MERKNVGEIRDAYNELLEKVVLALTDRNLAKVARNIRIHENTLRTIANGKNKRPAFETLEILADYLFGDSK